MNKDFGSIFSTLLPGANAMLAPPEGQTVLDGLEFKVALGNTWKENVTELSGGQRYVIPLQLTVSHGYYISSFYLLCNSVSVLVWLAA